MPKPVEQIAVNLLPELGELSPLFDGLDQNSEQLNLVALAKPEKQGAGKTFSQNKSDLTSLLSVLDAVLELDIKSMDTSDDGRVTLDELKAYAQSADIDSKKSLDSLVNSFNQLAHTRQDPLNKELLLANVNKLTQDLPELKGHLVFVASYFKQPRISLQGLISEKEYLEQDLKYHREKLHSLASYAKDIDSVLQDFDRLLLKYNSSASDGIDPYFLKRLKANEIPDQQMADCIRYLQSQEYYHPGELTIKKERLQQQLDRHKNLGSLVTKPADIVQLEYAISNFDKVWAMTGGDSAALSLSKLVQDKHHNDPTVSFLIQIITRVDLNRDTQITRKELETFFTEQNQILENERAKFAKIKSKDEESLKHLNPIIEAFDKLQAKYPDNSLGFSEKDLSKFGKQVLLQAVSKHILSAKKGSHPILPPQLRHAMQHYLSEEYTEKNDKNLVSMQQQLNNVIQRSGYQYRISVEPTKGAHELTGIKISVKLVEAKSSKNVYSFSFAFDTVR